MIDLSTVRVLQRTLGLPVNAGVEGVRLRGLIRETDPGVLWIGDERSGWTCRADWEPLPCHALYRPRQLAQQGRLGGLGNLGDAATVAVVNHPLEAVAWATLRWWQQAEGDLPGRVPMVLWLDRNLPDAESIEALADRWVVIYASGSGWATCLGQRLANLLLDHSDVAGVGVWSPPSGFETLRELARNLDDEDELGPMSGLPHGEDLGLGNLHLGGLPPPIKADGPQPITADRPSFELVSKELADAYQEYPQQEEPSQERFGR